MNVNFEHKQQSMIKTGILGADTTAAGELIRILINHPDVELVTIASDNRTGLPASTIHRGLIGDTDLSFTPTLTPRGHDAVFLCGEPWMAAKWMQANGDAAAASNLRIIDLTGAFRDGTCGMVYGLPEHNRKALVRGATRTSIPSPAATAVELALFPLAKNSLLHNPVNATVDIAATETFTTNPTTESDRTTSTRLDPIAPIENRPDSELAAREITTAMQAVQPTFTQPVTLRLARNNTSPRGITATVDTPCTIPLPELRRLYAEAYSDHNFTYPVPTPPVIADVANTNKCLLHLGYITPPGTGLPTLRITTVIDNLLKGSAGTAVHCLNLLFGLSERTGLSLKASAF